MSIEQSVQAVRAPEGSGVRRVGIAMNGVTGRMGRTSTCPLDPRHPRPGRRRARARGDLARAGADRPRRAQARRGWPPSTASSAGAPTSTPRSPTRASGSTSTRRSRRSRPDAVRRAIAAGKDVYCEKPVTETLAEGLELARLARDAGVRNGVVQDKLFLPGLIKLRELIDSGFFGRILSRPRRVRLLGLPRPGARSRSGRAGTTARRTAAGSSSTCSATGATCSTTCSARCARCRRSGRSTSRADRRGRATPYAVTAEDAAYATFEIEDGPIVQMNSSWCVRVDRDELFELQVDGTDGSAVAGPARVPHPARGGDADAGLEPRHPEPDRPPRAVAARARPRRARQRLQAPVGAVPPPRRRSTSRSRGTSSRRPRASSSPSSGMRVVDGAALRRGPGAGAVSAATDDRDAPAAARGGAIEAYTPGAPSPYAPPAAPAAHAASRSPPPTSSPTRSPPAIPAARRSSTGRRRSPSAATCGSTASRVAEAMDTAQRGMGLDWAATQRADPPQRRRGARRRRDDRRAARAPTTWRRRRDLDLAVVRAAYEEQCAFVEGTGAQVILMASRALAAAARAPGGLRGDLRPRARRSSSGRRSCTGSARRSTPRSPDTGATTTSTPPATRCWRSSPTHVAKVDGVKVSLLDARRARSRCAARCRDGVRMYTGDDFDYPALIRGDAHGHSDALLGIFDAIAPGGGDGARRARRRRPRPLRRDPRADRGALAPHLPGADLPLQDRRRLPRLPQRPPGATSAWSAARRARARSRTSPSCSCSPTAPALLRDPELAAARMRARARAGRAWTQP